MVMARPAVVAVVFDPGSPVDPEVELLPLGLGFDEEVLWPPVGEPEELPPESKNTGTAMRAITATRATPKPIRRRRMTVFLLRLDDE